MIQDTFTEEALLSFPSYDLNKLQVRPEERLGLIRQIKIDNVRKQKVSLSQLTSLLEEQGLS